MKPVSPRRAAVVAGLDIGTSKVVCLIARLEPQAPQDVLRRRSHGVRLLAFAHTAAQRNEGRLGRRLGRKPSRWSARQSTLPKACAGVQLRVSRGVDVGRPSRQRTLRREHRSCRSRGDRKPISAGCSGGRQPSLGARRARRPAFPANWLCGRCRHRHPRTARHAWPPTRRRYAHGYRRCGDRCGI